MTVAALAGGLSGLAVPSLLRRLPDPDPEIPWASGPEHQVLAARPGLMPRCAGVGIVSGLLLGWSLPGPWPLLLWLSLIPFGILLSVVDWHTQKLPRLLVLPLTAYALTVIAVVELSRGEPMRVLWAVAGMLAVRSLVWVLWAVGGFGFGDVRLAALLGLLLAHVSLYAVVIGVEVSFLLLVIPVLAWALIHRDSRVFGRQYAFGPFLLAGAPIGVALAKLAYGA